MQTPITPELIQAASEAGVTIVLLIIFLALVLFGGLSLLLFLRQRAPLITSESEREKLAASTTSDMAKVQIGMTKALLESASAQRLAAQASAQNADNQRQMLVILNRMDKRGEQIITAMGIFNKKVDYLRAVIEPSKGKTNGLGNPL